MPLLLLLHLAALICWCGALLYMPALIAAGTRREDALFFRDHAHLTRLVFTLIATPAALLAIASGTGLFLRDGQLGLWLVAKLGVVSLLVVCHALCGTLILRIERTPERRIVPQCVAAGAAATLFIVAILWLVLAKPF